MSLLYLEWIPDSIRDCLDCYEEDDADNELLSSQYKLRSRVVNDSPNKETKKKEKVPPNPRKIFIYLLHLTCLMSHYTYAVFHNEFLIV